MDTIYTRAHRRLIKALRAARIAAGFRQVDVARHLGKPQPFVSQLESGNRRVDVIELARLCNLYGIEMPAFLAGLDLQRSVRSPRKDQ